MSDSNRAPPTRWVEEPSRPELRRLLGGVESTDPPPGARERSWRILSARNAARPSFKALAVASGLGACVALAVVWAALPAVPAQEDLAVLPEPLTASVTPLAGAVSLSGTQVSSEAALLAGSIVRTGEGTRAVLKFPGSLLELGEGSVLAVERINARGTEVRLEAGSVAVNAPGRALVVRSGEAYVEGASYSVQVAADGARLSVRSFEGSTVVREGDWAVRLEQGEVWPTTRAAEVTVEPHQTVALAEQPSRKPQPRRTAPAPEVAAPPVPDAPTDATLWAAATLAIREGRAQDALTPLQTLAAGDGAYAGLALYELGRVRARHLGDPAGAKAAYSDYRQRMPEGPLRTEVDVSLAELLFAQRAFDEARAVIDDLLQRNPGSAREPQLRLLRAHALRERGEFGGAASAYLQLSKNAGRVGADALYYGAFCEQKLGRWASARGLLEDYLERYPGGRFAAEAKKALGISEGRSGSGHSRARD